MTEFDSSRDFYVIGLINMSFCTTSYDGHYYCTHYNIIGLRLIYQNENLFVKQNYH